MIEDMLAEFTEKHHEKIRKEIDSISRVGNAYTKKLPREVHMKVVRQGFKEELLQNCQKKETLQMQGN